METYSERIMRELGVSSHDKPYLAYCAVRDKVFSMLNNQPKEIRASEYWRQEIEGMKYTLDASPFIVEKLRHHSYHLTGLYEYLYRTHHVYKARPYLEKLQALRAADINKLEVPEHPALGGFGHTFDGKLYNLDTLKFYEVLIGLDRAGFLEDSKANKKQIVVEIGSGWGGFAYQFKTLFPNTTYVLVDFPQSLLFSATYLSTLFPSARIHISDGTTESLSSLQIADYDFVFVPHYGWSVLKKQHVDLAINMVSFQEMTDAQIRNYVSQLAEWKCSRLYSLNRDISPNNKELSGVSRIIEEKYTLQEIEILPIPYHSLSFPKTSFKKEVKHIIKRVLNYKGVRAAREYRHLACTLK